MQVGYLPWLGFFDQIYKCDIYVLSIQVQYNKYSWRNRNRIRTKEGWCWLTVPIFTKGKFGQKLKEVKIDNQQNWAKKHWNIIKNYYYKAPYFSKYASFFEELYRKRWEYIVDLDLAIIAYLLGQLGIKTKIILSSQLVSQATKTEGIIDICRELGATEYLSPSAGRNYIQENKIFSLGIQLEYHDYIHPVYKQQYSGFVPYLSVIDLLFNHGEKSLEILTNKEKIIISTENYANQS
jgi:hypothetical protein